MPAFLQAVTHVVPARYFLVILRGIVLKGVGPATVLGDAGVPLAVSSLSSILALASLRLRRQWA